MTLRDILNFILDFNLLWLVVIGFCIWIGFYALKLLISLYLATKKVAPEALNEFSRVTSFDKWRKYLLTGLAIIALVVLISFPLTALYSAIRDMF